MRDLLSLLHVSVWHANLFRASLRQCLRALIPPKGAKWMEEEQQRPAVRSPMDFLVSNQVLFVTALKDEFHATVKINAKINATKGMK